MTRPVAASRKWLRISGGLIRLPPSRPCRIPPRASQIVSKTKPPPAVSTQAMSAAHFILREHYHPGGFLKPPRSAYAHIVPMPHRTQMQVIKRRLVGKEGGERIRELRAILEELPNYRSGPYADIRKWVNSELDAARTRTRVVHRDSIAVRREGAAQIALVGPPNSGKSSLLQALSNVQIKTGDYAFTTTRPVPALTRIRGVLVQLVEIPGLIEGASEGRGGGRALLGVLRNADAMVLCHDASADLGELETIRREVAESGISLPAILAATKADEAAPNAVDRVRREV